MTDELDTTIDRLTAEVEELQRQRTAQWRKEGRSRAVSDLRNAIQEGFDCGITEDQLRDEFERAIRTKGEYSA